jgi:hypothetical protein
MPNPLKPTDLATFYTILNNLWLEKPPLVARQGRKWRKSGVYKCVNEHFESISQPSLTPPEAFLEA